VVRKLKEVLNKKYSFLIIGCGHFGSRAAQQLLKKNPSAKIIIVDKDKKASQKVSRLPVEISFCDGIAYLKQFLSGGRKVNYIIPAVPLHLAFEFILSLLKPQGAKRKRIPPIAGLPNPMTGKTGDLYTSLANFRCSENCPEPAQYCTITKKRRPKPLYQILKDIEGSFESKVIRSHQLTLGVGGFKPEALLDLIENIKKRTKPHRSILISTASRCHGVTSALSF
jgi:hypothetical protein